MSLKNLYFYRGEDVNNSFDILDLKTNINPIFINKHNYKFNELLTIKKITISSFNNIIKRIYIHNGLHPKVNLETGLFKTNDFKNKRLNHDIIFDIKYKIQNNYIRYFDNYFIKKCNSIKRFIIEDKYLIYFFNKNIFNIKYDMYEIRKLIKPEIVINEDSKILNINDISDNLIIEKVKIFTHQDKIQSIYLDSPHPNSRITDRCYCTPLFLNQKNIFEIKVSFMEELLKTYFLKNPYFYPWRYIKCQSC